MTYEEATMPENIIKYLEKRRMCPCAWCTSDKCVPEPLMDDCKQKDFVVNTAIEAIEKQIKKKPKLSTAKSTLCPNCGRFIDRHEQQHGNIDIPCCKWCGQAIDWSDEE